MEITLNGERVITSSGNLSELVSEQAPGQTAMVAEYNYEIVQPAQWESIKIKDGDNIELLSFVGGG